MNTILCITLSPFDIVASLTTAVKFTSVSPTPEQQVLDELDRHSNNNDKPECLISLCKCIMQGNKCNCTEIYPLLFHSLSLCVFLLRNVRMTITLMKNSKLNKEARQKWLQVMKKEIMSSKESDEDDYMIVDPLQ